MGSLQLTAQRDVSFSLFPLRFLPILHTKGGSSQDSNHAITGRGEDRLPLDNGASLPINGPNINRIDRGEEGERESMVDAQLNLHCRLAGLRLEHCRDAQKGFQLFRLLSHVRLEPPRPSGSRAGKQYTTKKQGNGEERKRDEIFLDSLKDLVERAKPIFTYLPPVPFSLRFSDSTSLLYFSLRNRHHQ